MLACSEVLNMKSLHLLGEEVSGSLKDEVVVYVHSDVVFETVHVLEQQKKRYFSLKDILQDPKPVFLLLLWNLE